RHRARGGGAPGRGAPGWGEPAVVGNRRTASRREELPHPSPGGVSGPEGDRERRPAAGHGVFRLALVSRKGLALLSGPLRRRPPRAAGAGIRAVGVSTKPVADRRGRPGLSPLPWARRRPLGGAP